MGLILLRYGEVGLKGKNQSRFVRKLRQNARDCLKKNGIQGSVYSTRSRVYVETDAVDEAIPHLQRVFGFVSLSPVIEVARNIDAIIQECVAQAMRAKVNPAMSFRVRSRRSDKRFPLTSPEIDRLAGEAIVRELGGKVDLSKNADVTIGVEITVDSVLVFGANYPAPGGLPLGIEGRVVALMSGGIDSPVAAWLMMRRGCGIVPLHFSQNEIETAKTMDNIAVLEQYGYGWTMRPEVASHFEVLEPIVKALDEMHERRWTCVFCKRAIVSRACARAQELGAEAVVMGDNLGQVASQTLSNMTLITHGMPVPILRPLIGYDKTEIIDLARCIGTFDISTRAEEPCPFLPPNPATRGRLEVMLEIEARLRAAGAI